MRVYVFLLKVIFQYLFKTAHSHNLNQITVLLKSVYKHAVFNIQNEVYEINCLSYF